MDQGDQITSHMDQGISMTTYMDRDVLMTSQEPSYHEEYNFQKVEIPRFEESGGYKVIVWMNMTHY